MIRIMIKDRVIIRIKNRIMIKQKLESSSQHSL